MTEYVMVEQSHSIKQQTGGPPPQKRKQTRSRTPTSTYLYGSLPRVGSIGALQN